MVYNAAFDLVPPIDETYGGSTTTYWCDYNWTNNSTEGNAAPTDKMVVVVYEETSNSSWYSLNLGTRSASSALLDLPAYTAGLTVHVWATFAKADDAMAATSQYLGTVVLT